MICLAILGRMARSSPFTPTEQRALGLGFVLLTMGTAARLLLAPGQSEYAWNPSSSPRPPNSVSELHDAVSDSLGRLEVSSRPLGPGETIDVNHADAAQLQRLPGVGAARAEAIVRERAANGQFHSPADLTRVPGVGSGLLERWGDRVTASVPGGANLALETAPLRVDLNRAQPNELQQITGIGPALAARIVDARTRRGSFESLEDLLEVPGIGPKTLEMLGDQAFVR